MKRYTVVLIPELEDGEYSVTGPALRDLIGRLMESHISGDLSFDQTDLAGRA